MVFKERQRKFSGAGLVKWLVTPWRRVSDEGTVAPLNACAAAPRPGEGF